MDGSNCNGLPAEPSELELKDYYDDPKYAKDDLMTYLSMRNNGKQTRKQYLETLDNDRQKRLNHEQERIDKLRDKFFANQTKLDLIAKHENCRNEWRDEARGAQKWNLEDLQTRRLKYFCTNPDDGPKKGRQVRAFKNEERVLKAIQGWPVEEEKPKAQVPVEPVPTDPTAGKQKLKYGLKACIMHFRKGHGGHTHHHPKVDGNFPNQKIPIEELLSDTLDNPLKEHCKEEMYRYFHLPTNNMAWIEVTTRD
jgi:hypothetical protein